MVADLDRLAQRVGKTAPNVVPRKQRPAGRPDPPLGLAPTELQRRTKQALLGIKKCLERTSKDLLATSEALSVTREWQ
jgi:hypothetical protein